MIKLEIIKYNSVAATTHLTPQEMVKLQPELPDSPSSVSKGTLTGQKPTISSAACWFYTKMKISFCHALVLQNPPLFLFMFSENCEMAIFHVITAY